MADSPTLRAGENDAKEVGAIAFADAIQEAAKDRDRVRVAIPGASIANVGVRAVAILAERGFDLERLCLTWVDERCVNVASPDSNRGAIEFTPEPGTLLPLVLDDEAPSDSVARVDHELRSTFDSALDVVLLGMGPDGHIASLFPGHPELPGLVGHVDNSPKPPPNRITLTRKILETAQTTLLVATGEPKREALMRILAGDTELPATGLPNLSIITDIPIEEENRA